MALFITRFFRQCFSWRKVKSILKISHDYLFKNSAYFYCNYTKYAFVTGVLLTILVFSIFGASPAYGVTNSRTETNLSRKLPQRDPFTTSDFMYSEVGNPQRAGSAQGFVPGYGPQTAPKMRLKGFINRGAKKMVALLEVEGAGVYLVSEGDEIGLQTLGQNAVIKVVKIDINGVRVQAGRVNQVILVR